MRLYEALGKVVLTILFKVTHPIINKEFQIIRDAHGWILIRRNKAR